MINFPFYVYFVPVVPSSRAHAVLSVSDMCVAPLKPLVLQPKDKANLTEWLKTLWSTNVDSEENLMSN